MNDVRDNGRIKYDVFISAKSEDYSLAEGISKFLVDNGLSVFLASAELRKIGNANYAEAIDIALDSAKHMIVVASRIDYIRSSFVHYEWSVFSNDLKSGYRTGNLLTILTDGISLRELPPSLRHQQSYHIDTYQMEILGYLGVQENSPTIVCHKKRVSQRVRIFLYCSLLILSMAVTLCTGMAIERWYAKSLSSTAYDRMNERNREVLYARENNQLVGEGEYMVSKMGQRVGSVGPSLQR